MFRILSDTFFILFANAKIIKSYHICKYLVRKVYLICKFISLIANDLQP